MTEAAAPIPRRAAASERERPTAVIVGGGFSGAVVAYQLARRAPNAFRIIVVEPRAQLGSGVAYSTADPSHRINVPASRMTFLQSDPCHFDRWLRSDRALVEDPDALLPDGRAFPRRSVFGRYISETIEPFLLSSEIEHRRTLVTSIQSSGDGRHSVALSEGEPIEADYVVLAATHPSPEPLPAFYGVLDDPRLIADTQSASALDKVGEQARVLIVGTGLTMADIVASLDAHGHRGPITAVSRRGLLSRGHAETSGDYGDFTTRPSSTARDLVRRARQTIAAAENEGKRWQHVCDALRAQGRAIWDALDERERRTVVRRLRPFWDVHRFRVAPQVENVVRRRRAEGSFRVIAGELVVARSADDGLQVEIRPRGRAAETHAFDAVALATGPAHRALVRTDPLIAGLAAGGAVRLDRVGLGLDVDLDSRPVGADGQARTNFWIAGPLARGTFGELMGLPEVGRQAEQVAGDILRAQGLRAPKLQDVA